MTVVIVDGSLHSSAGSCNQAQDSDDRCRCRNSADGYRCCGSDDRCPCRRCSSADSDRCCGYDDRCRCSNVADGSRCCGSDDRRCCKEQPEGILSKQRIPVVVVVVVVVGVVRRFVLTLVAVGCELVKDATLFYGGSSFTQKTEHHSRGRDCMLLQ